MPSIESVILHKLLAELEGRQGAPVPAPYRMEPLPPARHTRLIRTLWSSLWALSLVLCIVIVKYLDSQQVAGKIDTAQAQSINTLTAAIGAQRAELSKMIDASQGLAGVIASTSARTAAVSDMLQRLASNIKQTPFPSGPTASPAEQTASLPVVIEGERAAPALITLGQPEGSTEISLGGHHHAPMETSVAPSDAVVHHNSLGLMDYWLMPRLVSGAWSMVKVVPIAEGPTGIFVHDVAEVKDYIVTPTRDWIAISEQPPLIGLSGR